MANKLIEQAAKLKEEGNGLFIQKRYVEAYAKYSEAIDRDSTIATYLANRAACSLNMRKYLDAMYDASQALQLDPSYAKAMARMATAEFMIGSFTKSIESWEAAIALLPTKNLSPAELKQKAEWTRDIATAKAKKVELRNTPTPPLPHPTQAPWLRAMFYKTKLDQKGVEGLRSSVWVILPAYRLWWCGNEALMKYGSTANVDPTILENFTDALVRDSRIFHVENVNAFSDSFNAYIASLRTKYRSLSSGGAEYITSQFLQRERQEGWRTVRNALNITVRAYLLHGFTTGRLQEHRGAEEVCLRCVLDILEWGNAGPWKDVPVEVKGSIFARKFVRVVRALHMTAYREANNEDPKTYPVDILYEEAKGALLECESAEEKEADNPDDDPGFVNAFYNYPKGYAHSMIGYYHFKIVSQTVVDPEAAKLHYRKAAEAYIDAAECLPQDDELYVQWLFFAVVNMLKYGALIQDLVPIMDKLRVAEPEVQKIWKYSPVMVGKSGEAIQDIISTEKQLLEGIITGKYRLEDPMIPEHSLPK